MVQQKVLPPVPSQLPAGPDVPLLDACIPF